MKKALDIITNVLLGIMAAVVIAMVVFAISSIAKYGSVTAGIVNQLTEDSFPNAKMYKCGDGYIYTHGCDDYVLYEDENGNLTVYKNADIYE